MLFGNSRWSVSAQHRQGVWPRWPLQPWQSVIALAVLAGVALIAFTGSHLHRQYQRELEATGTRTQDMARVLEGHTRQVLRRVDLLMTAAAEELTGLANPVVAEPEALRQRLRALLPSDRLIRSFSVMDATGRLLVSTVDQATHGVPTAQERDFFAVHLLDAHRGVFMGATTRGRLTGTLMVPFSVRLNGPDGGFIGVLLGAVDPAYFQEFHDAFDKGPSGFVAVFGRDGSILARAPFDEGLMHRNWAHTPLFREHLPAASVNTVRQVVAVDGVERIYTYRAMSDYPVVVSAGWSLVDALSPWRREAWRDGLSTLAVLAGLALMAFLLARQLRVAQRIEESLEYSRERLRALSDVTFEAVFLSVKGICREQNRQAQHMFGYSDDEAVGQPGTQWIALRDRQTVTDNMKAGYELPYEVTAQRKDGSTFPAVIRARMMLFRGESVRVTSVLDITEVKQAQAEVLASKRRLRLLSRHLLQAQEETRRRFASELHDRTSPNLAALRINLHFIASASPEQRISHVFVDRVLDTQALIEDTTASIREICADLHPAVLDGAGLLGAVRSYAYQFGQRTGVPVTVECPHAERRLARELELALFRIVQEAMTNSAKHAKARRLAVRLELDSNPLRVTITDDGVGMNAEQSDSPALGAGLGMRTMRDTAEFVGGRFSVQTALGQGTQVRVEIDGALEELNP